MSHFERITGPGRYRMRNGQIATISHQVLAYASGFATHYSTWRGSILGEQLDGRWEDTGRICGFEISVYDIVVGPLAAEPQEMAGLSGFAGVQQDRVIGFKTAEKAFELGWEAVVDFSKVPASAIVKPEPKRETRRVRLYLFEDFVAARYEDENDIPVAEPLAVVEQEISFAYGEGLS